MVSQILVQDNHGEEGRQQSRNRSCCRPGMRVAQASAWPNSRLAAVAVSPMHRAEGPPPAGIMANALLMDLEAQRFAAASTAAQAADARFTQAAIVRQPKPTRPIATSRALKELAASDAIARQQLDAAQLAADVVACRAAPGAGSNVNAAREPRSGRRVVWPRRKRASCPDHAGRLQQIETAQFTAPILPMLAWRSRGGLHARVNCSYACTEGAGRRTTAAVTAVRRARRSSGAGRSAFRAAGAPTRRTRRELQGSADRQMSPWQSCRGPD